MSLGMELGFDPGHIVLDDDPAPLPKKGQRHPSFSPFLLSSPEKGAHPPQFSTHAYCSQTAAWIRIPLGNEVGLSPGDIVLDGDHLLIP